jgi:hypothetical protein
MEQVLSHVLRPKPIRRRLEVGSESRHLSKVGLDRTRRHIPKPHVFGHGLA